MKEEIELTMTLDRFYLKDMIFIIQKATIPAL